MEELKFDKETAEALYRIFCGLSSSCYDRAEVYDEAKPNMKKAYEKVIDWGSKNCNDIRGEKLRGINRDDYDVYDKVSTEVDEEYKNMSDEEKRITESFEYSDIDSFSYILPMTTNNKSSEYIKTVDKNDSNISLQKFRFQNHLINWQNKTMFLSSTKEIIENKDFQAIVAMGYTAVPYILESIENEPSTLVWALNFIYNRKISNNPNTTISDACKLWTKWYKNI